MSEKGYRVKYDIAGNDRSGYATGKSKKDAVDYKRECCGRHPNDCCQFTICHEKSSIPYNGFIIVISYFKPKLNV